MESSSSDSSNDDGEKVKNIQSMLIKSRDSQQELDWNYAYKRKLGDLIFDANFEGGNLGYVEQVDQYDYDLMVRPDVSNPRYRIWFNFTVSNQKPSQCVVFTFVNLSENLALLNEGLTPVARNRLQPNWRRLHEDQVFYYRSSNHNNRLVLSIAFKFSNHDNEHQFALFYPYTFSSMESFINRWTVELKRHSLDRAEPGKMFKTDETPEHHGGSVSCLSTESKVHKSPHREDQRTRSSQGQQSAATKWHKRSGEYVGFKINVLAHSTLSKPIYLLSISGQMVHSTNKPKVIIFRQSSGNFDSSSSFVCQAFVDMMLSNHLVAIVARSHIDSIVFPMLDPDSVWAGNSRTDIMGQPCISPKILEANPTLYENFGTAQEIINEVCSKTKNRLILIELKVNPHLIGSRMVGTIYEDSFRMERHLHLPRLLSRFADGFYLEKCEFKCLDHSMNSIFDFRK